MADDRGLTGTPLENRTGELWSLFSVLLPGLLGTRSPFLLRRTKDAVAADLPDRSDHVLAVALSPAERRLCDGRARLLRFARGSDGRSGLLAGLALLGALEAEHQAALGGARWLALHDALYALEPLLESWRAEDPAG